MSTYIENVNFNFLYIDTYAFGRNWVFPESVVPYNMLRYIEKGTGVFFINNREIAVKEGMVIYIPCDARLSCYATTDNFTFTSVRFTTSVFFKGADFLTDVYGMPSVMEGSGVKRYFEEMMYWVKNEHTARMFLVRGALTTLIGELIVKEGNQNLTDSVVNEELEIHSLEQVRQRMRKSKNKMDPRIQIVVDYVLLHPTEKYTPEKMAEMAELSKQRFGSLFKEQVGKTPMTYVKEIKMTTAARKLLVSNNNINDISYEMGYNDPNYFIREFRESFGYTPKQYRQAIKE